MENCESRTIGTQTTEEFTYSSILPFPLYIQAWDIELVKYHMELICRRTPEFSIYRQYQICQTFYETDFKICEQYFIRNKIRNSTTKLIVLEKSFTIKGISSFFTDEDILSEMKDNKLPVIELTRVESGDTFFIITINSEDEQLLRNIPFLSYMTITIERHYTIDQCKNCCGFRHTQCTLPPKCAKCAGNHRTENCNSPFCRCANCNLSHPATFRGCRFWSWNQALYDKFLHIELTTPDPYWYIRKPTYKRNCAHKHVQTDSMPPHIKLAIKQKNQLRKHYARHKLPDTSQKIRELQKYITDQLKEFDLKK